MKKNTVSVLIRSFNESKWINLCLSNLSKQIKKPYEIVIIDNNSNDGTDQLIKNSNCKNKYYEYNKNYLPGKMLNYGISKCKGEFILIISAHCIPCDNKLIIKLLNPMIKNQKICASYSRQLSLNFSDDFAIRDLMLTYGVESRLQKTDPQFNNACSLIRKKDWKKIKFDEKITNLEDRLWASKMQKRGRYIYYSAESNVFHYHGSHHQNNSERLKNTKKTIIQKKQFFNIDQRKLNIGRNSILPIFIHNDLSNSELYKKIVNIDKYFGNKSLILTKKKINFSFKKNKIIKRNLKEVENQNLYLSDVLDYYKIDILKNLVEKEYLFICTDNVEKLSNTKITKILSTINDFFPDTIYSAIKTHDPIFSYDGGSFNKLNKYNFSRKENQPLLLAQRQFGIIIHKSNLFKQDKFSGLIKIIT